MNEYEVELQIEVEGTSCLLKMYVSAEDGTDAVIRAIDRFFSTVSVIEKNVRRIDK